MAVAGIWVGAAWVFCAQDSLSGADYRGGTPFTYLFDTGSSSPRALSGRTLAAKTGWTLLPEDKLAHRFKGDVVLLNDKLTIVLRVKGPGAEVYSQTPTGLRERAVLVPLPAAGRKVTGLASVKIVENAPGAVALAATFATAGDGCPSAKLRLTTGRSILEIHPGEAAQRLVVWDRPRWVVVPSFFGNDMVFGPETFRCLRHGLPAENFFLNLLGDGDAMVMCVWKSSRRWADVLLQEKDGRREFGGCEIECGRDEPIWVAFLEAPGIWSDWQQPPEPGEDLPLTLPGERPFAAKRRVDLFLRSGLANSFDLEGQWQVDAETVRQMKSVQRKAVLAGYLPLVLTYPIDRTRGTPLTAFCPTDVLRNTLGVGPCQYILQTEGLASETNPTPAKVADWVEKQFEKGKEQEAADQIRDLLGQMTKHVGRAQAKIERYSQFGQEIVLLCAAQRQDAHATEDADLLSRTARILEARKHAGGTGGEQFAALLARDIVALIGRENTLGECRKNCELLRYMGAAQDRALSNCRMAVRWLRQQASGRAAGDTSQTKLAREVFARAERMLRDE